MKTCGKCGWPFADGARFCKQCGSPLSAAGSESPEIRARRQMFSIDVLSTPDSPEIYLEYARFLDANGLQSEASSVLERATGACPRDVGLRRALVDSLISLQSWDDAAVHLIVLIELAPADLQSRLELADIYARANRSDERRQALLKASETPCTNVALLWRLATSLKVAGLRDQFVAVCRRIVGIDPKHQALADMVNVLYSAGNLEDAAAACRTILAYRPDDAKARLVTAMSAFDAALDAPGPQRVAVLKSLDVALSQPDCITKAEATSARLRKAALLIADDDADGGTHILEKIDVSLVAKNDWQLLAASWTRAGSIAADGSDISGAIYRLNKAYTLAGGDDVARALADLHVVLADQLRQEARFEDAVNVARQGLEFQNTDELRMEIAEVLVEHGESHLAAGRLDEAFGLLTEASCIPFNDRSELDARMDAGLTLISNIRRRKKRIILTIVAGSVAALIATVLIVYLAHGSVEIEVPFSTSMVLLNGDEVVAESRGSYLKFPVNTGDSLPWSGSYTLRATAADGGFAPLDTKIKVPWFLSHSKLKINMVVEDGDLAIETVPPGAAVKLTNAHQNMACTSPCVIKDVMTVQSDIEYTLPGIPPRHVSVRPVKGTETTVEKVVFPAWVGVTTTPDGVELFIDGKPTGKKSPDHLAIDQPGVHTISGSKEGHDVGSVEVLAAYGKVIEAELPVTPVFGKVMVESRYEDGSACRGAVYIGGVLTSAWTWTAVLAMDHQVSVSCDLGSATTTATAVRDKSVKVQIDVPSISGAIDKGTLLLFDSRVWYPGATSRYSPTLITRSAASAYCDNLRAGHLTGWRLPSAAELKSLLAATSEKLLETGESEGPLKYEKSLYYSFESGAKTWIGVGHWVSDTEVQDPTWDNRYPAPGGVMVSIIPHLKYEPEERAAPYLKDPFNPPSDWEDPTGLVICVRDTSF